MYNYLRDNSEKIHYWGLGFIQIRMSEDVNYHFFHKKLPKTFDVESPHNHRRGFTSTIIAGSLTETVYGIEMCDDGEYTLTPNGCTVGNVTSNRYNVKSITTLNHTTGDWYERKGDEYHTVISDDFCITKVVKTGSDYQVTSLAKGVDNDNASGVYYTEEELWEIVEDMLCTI